MTKEWSRIFLLAIYMGGFLFFLLLFLAWIRSFSRWWGTMVREPEDREENRDKTNTRTKDAKDTKGKTL